MVEEFNGKVPTDPKDLLSFYGVGCKICSLVLQDACKERGVGLVVDTHLAVVLPMLGWTKMTKADDIAQDVESWLPVDKYLMVNEVFCGLRQLWNKGRETQDLMKAEAEKLPQDECELIIRICSVAKSKKRE